MSMAEAFLVSITVLVIMRLNWVKMHVSPLVIDMDEMAVIIYVVVA